MSHHTHINWDRLHDGSDVILIDGFPKDRDTGEYPDETYRLDRVPVGARVQDRNGNRFRVLGAGSVQGSVVIHDRYRRQYMTDADVRVRVIS